MDYAFAMSLDQIPPPSPCKGICQLEGETCLGCGRVIGEVIEWPSASAARKTRICLDASARLLTLQPDSTTGNRNP